MAIESANRMEEEAEHRHWDLQRAEQGGPRKATILLVEDEAFVRGVTSEVLRSAGYRVFVAKNAEEAELLHQSYSDEIDLLITDIVLPKEDGHALAKKLIERQLELRILFVTGYGNRREGHDCGELEWLAKPFSSRALLERVGKLTGCESEATPVRHACGNESPERSAWESARVERCGWRTPDSAQARGMP